MQYWWAHSPYVFYVLSAYIISVLALISPMLIVRRLKKQTQIKRDLQQQYQHRRISQASKAHLNEIKT